MKIQVDKGLKLHFRRSFVQSGPVPVITRVITSLIVYRGEQKPSAP